MDLPSYDYLAERFSHISDRKVLVKDLRRFEQPQGVPMASSIITPRLSGYSGAYARRGYDATFKLQLTGKSEYLVAQRIYYNGERTSNEVVRETLDALIGLYNKFISGRCSGINDYTDFNTI